MNRPLLLLLSLLVLQFSALAQQPGCDGERYRQRVFANVDSTIDIAYGSNFSHSGFLVNLFMDVYEPAGDSLTERPLIVVAHGGSFYSGNKQQVRELCLDYAKRGYVAAAINYRLYYNIGTPLDSFGLYDVVVKAVGDMKASIRYLKQSADSGNPYGIDPDWVFASGVSAGGIAAMVSGYLTDTSLVADYFQDIIDSNGGIEGNTLMNYQYSSEVKGVVSYSGALRDTSWIAPNNLTPAFCVHEDGDPIVPYGAAQVSNAGITITLMGSLAITEKLAQNGAYFDLVTYENSAGHVSYFLDTAGENYLYVLDQTASFLNTIYCPNFSDTIAPANGISETSIGGSSIQLYPNPASESLQVAFSAAGNHDLAVYSLEGRIMTEQRNASSSISLDVSQLPAGIYILQSTHDEHGVSHERFVVHR